MKISIDNLYDTWLNITKKILDCDVSKEEKSVIYGILKEAGELWKEGEKVKLSDGKIIERKKSSRTILVVNFMDECGKTTNESMLPISILIDAIVNAADESSDFDYSKVPKEEIYKNNVRFGVSWSLLLSYVSEHLEDFVMNEDLRGKVSKVFDGNIVNYAVKLSLIPAVERKTYEEILKSEDVEEEIHSSLKNYLYRSHDIDIFSSIFIETSDVDDEEKSVLYETMRYLRALDILAKDLYDLEYDIERQDAYTPLVAIYKKHGIAGVIKYVGMIRNRLVEMALKTINKYDGIKKAFMRSASYMFKDFI